MAAYKAGNVRKGAKKGPGKRTGGGAAKRSGSRVSGSRAQYVRRRRKSAGS